jgi:protein-L-isoaspartate(D-aspartate) O-methyltransferase
VGKTRGGSFARVAAPFQRFGHNHKQTMRLKLFRDSRSPGPTSGIRTGEIFAELRAEMVEKHLCRRGIRDSRVLDAMAAVPREEFVPDGLRQKAYDDAPLPIGDGQTISQPYIVAVMTAALRLTGEERVLEIGTGSGYQATILARLTKEVFTLERRCGLAAAATQRLAHLGYSNVHVRCGDGTLGLAEFAPFDAILVAAAAPVLPEPWHSQLAEGGRIIVPLGDSEDQELHLLERRGHSFQTTILEPCRFVPLVGYHGWKEPSPR